MIPYYEKGDEIEIKGDIDSLMKEHGYFSEPKGLEKIIDDVKGTKGIVFAVIEGSGHKSVLYKKEGVEHTWWIPVQIIK